MIGSDRLWSGMQQRFSSMGIRIRGLQMANMGRESQTDFL
jgi:hypothetical protein